MSVLSDVDIKNALKNSDGLIITEFNIEKLTAIGYDLTIGFIYDSDTGNAPQIESLQGKDRYKLLSGHRYIVISKEYIWLSKKLISTIHSRGSYALKGILISSITIDANYEGFITASLVNVTPYDVYIKTDNSFGTMIIHQLQTPTTAMLKKDENDLPKDALSAINNTYANICQETKNAVNQHVHVHREKIKYEFQECIAMSRRADSNKMRRIKKLNSITILLSKKFLGIACFLLIFAATIPSLLSLLGILNNPLAEWILEITPTIAAILFGYIEFGKLFNKRD